LKRGFTVKSRIFKRALFVNQPFTISEDLLGKLYERYSGSIEMMEWHASYTKEPEDPLEPLDSLQFQTFIQTAFWASLEQEESRFHNFTLLLMPPERTRMHYVFEGPVPLNVTNVAKLAPALDAQSNYLGVWLDEGAGLVIWGFAPASDTGLTAVTLDPGQLLVSFKEIGIEHFTLLLSGTRGEFVGRSEFLTWLVPESKTQRHLDVWRTHRNEVLRALDFRNITTFMRSHRHGGTLLVVKEDSEWRHSFHPSITFAAKEAYDKVKIDTFIRNRAMDEEREKRVVYVDSPRYKMAIESAKQSLETIGKLTAVDGATVISYDLDILAFGAKIKAQGERKPQRILISEPFEESTPREIDLAVLGGMRHQSAAQFVFDQRDALAFVASQDGRLSVMRWDAEKEIVTIIRPAEFALL
jgi:hypothetical protein